MSCEADTFWCLTKLVDDVQDNFTEDQPGVHKQLGKLRAILEQKVPETLKYLESIDIRFVDFAYRWVSAFLTREFSLT